jgi:hypothetical protein
MVKSEFTYPNSNTTHPRPDPKLNRPIVNKDQLSEKYSLMNLVRTKNRNTELIILAVWNIIMLGRCSRPAICPRKI